MKSTLAIASLATASLFGGTVWAQPASSSTAASAAAITDEEALYQRWVKDRSVEAARQYFTQFPRGTYQTAIVDDICRDQQFARVDGAPLLVRFRAYKLDSKAKIHDGKTFSGIPGLSMSPEIAERAAKKDHQFVFVLFEIFAFDTIQFKPADIAFPTRSGAPDLPTVQLFPEGSPNMIYGGFELSPEKNTSLLRLQAAWEVPVKNAAHPVIRLYRSQFDLAALKVQKL